jgi:MscS family membrane protein
MAELTNTVIAVNWLIKAVNYEIIRGNSFWRFVMVLLTMFIVMSLGRLAQYGIVIYTSRRESKGIDIITLLLRSLSRPIYVAIFAFGLFACKGFLYFNDHRGISTGIEAGWTKIAKTVTAIAFAYGLYKLVDVVEHYLEQWTSRTQTRLDNMLVPVVRKALRVTIAIIAILFVAESILDLGQIKTVLLSAGVGGIAIALAAKETIANFFGSVAIFADRPFQIDEVVKIGDYTGTVEEVGFRSTRLRTFDGSLVTIPNGKITDSVIENIGKRPSICRTANITITYESGHTRAKRAVEITKEVLAAVPQVNTDPKTPPRVYFNQFTDWALNISVTYWVKPADWWLYQQINENVNLEIMKRFEAEKIDFAYPSQTLYIKKDNPV